MTRWAVVAVALVLAAPLQPQSAASAPGRIRITSVAGETEIPWSGDRELARVLAALSKGGGGTVRFPPGVFEFDHGVSINGLHDVHVLGTAGLTVFRFRKLDDWGILRTKGQRPLDAASLAVTHPDLVRAGAYYQLFVPGRFPNRFLEFRAKAVSGDAVEITQTAVTNPRATDIPDGAYFVPQMSFFDGFQASRISFQDIVFDGGVPDVRNVRLGDHSFLGHTALCGLLFRNGYKDPKARPAGIDIRVERCVFRNLLGRGFVAYNTDGIRIRDCRFEDLRGEAIEIDHWCRDAVIDGVIVTSALVGIQLNDCNRCVVTACRFEKCTVGIAIVDALGDRTTNRNLVIRSNFFTDCEAGIRVPQFAEENAIVGNGFTRSGRVAIVIEADNVACTGNTISGSSEAGIVVGGRNCVIDGNVIVAPAAGEGFKPIVR